MGTAIPRITSEFHSLADVGWYIGAFTLASATLQPLSGKLYANLSTKVSTSFFRESSMPLITSQVVFLTFVLLFELGSLLCAVASSSAFLIVGRVVAGLGASGIVNGAMTMLAAAVPAEKSPGFYMNLPIGGAAAALITLVRIPERILKPRLTVSVFREVVSDLDLFGFVLFVPPSVMLLLALQLGSSGAQAWDSSVVIGLFCGAGICAILFILWEKRAEDQAMLPGKLLGKRVVWTSCVHASCIITCMMTASIWMPTYFQAVKNNGPTDSGVHVLPSILSQLLAVIATGAAVSRMGYYLPWALASGVITTIGNVLVSTFTVSTSTAVWIGYQIVLGAGRGCGMQMAIIAVQNAVPPSQYPIALASLVFFQNLSTSVAVVIANTIFAQTLTSKISLYVPSVSPRIVLDTGSSASAVRALVPLEELDGLLRAYSESLRNVFYFLSAIACIAVIASLGMGWKDIRKNSAEPEKDVAMDGVCQDGKKLEEP
ncbi:efflux pump protein [Alternaria sp. MG1]|nr:efflux pump protein [Alternaria sp. MG1]